MHIHVVVPANDRVLVAASDSTPAVRHRADFLCNGVDDQDIINAAIAAVRAAGSADIYYTDDTSVERTVKTQGGEVRLASGTYFFSGSLRNTTVHNLVLEGEGPGTLLIQQATDGSHCIDFDGSALPYGGLINCHVRNLQVQGNALSGDGVRMYACSHNGVDKVLASKCGGAGIRFIPNGSQGLGNKTITDCRCTQNYGPGIYLGAVHETLVADCHLEENAGGGLIGVGCIDLHLSNLSIEDNVAVGATYGLQLTGALYTTLSNVSCEDAATLGTASWLKMSASYFSTLTIVGSGASAEKVSISASELGTFSFSGVSYLEISGGSAVSVGNSSANRLAWTGSTYIGLNGTIDVTTMCALTGNYIYVLGASAIRVQGASCLLSFTGNNVLHAGAGRTITFDGNGKAAVRLTFTGNDTRSSQYVFEDLAIATIVANDFYGSDGTINFVNCDGQVRFGQNTLTTGVTTTVDATCGGAFAPENNTANSCNLVYNGTGARKNRFNTVLGTSTGWNTSQGRGTAIVASGATYVDVTHGLDFTPLAQDVAVTPTNGLGDATKFWISNLGATTFRVNVDADPGATTATFAWSALAP